mmetsp:Transcript_100188/g.157915  ORF Transcript_100188/g.157915 Transcript_100188/m.157915 type:complete len:287 (+) Transcript_100188:57-917(+)
MQSESSGSAQSVHVADAPGPVSAEIEKKGDRDQTCSVSTETEKDIVWDLPRRANMAWDRYHEFRTDPGERCADCWLLARHCCCKDLQGIRLRQRVVVVWHYAELDRRRGSNTAKLLLQFGAEILVWGVKEHEETLRELLEVEGDHAVVLFPSPGAIEASKIARGTPGRPELPRCIVVLDGGWKETRKINQAIDQRVLRCCVSSATRDEYGSTRKYNPTNDGDHGRVQTAAAFVAFLKEIGEDAEKVAELRTGLGCFLAAFERQLNWSGVSLAARARPKNCQPGGET